MGWANNTWHIPSSKQINQCLTCNTAWMKYCRFNMGNWMWEGLLSKGHFPSFKSPPTAHSGQKSVGSTWWPALQAVEIPKNLYDVNNPASIKGMKPCTNKEGLWCKCHFLIFKPTPWISHSSWVATRILGNSYKLCYCTFKSASALWLSKLCFATSLFSRVWTLEC